MTYLDNGATSLHKPQTVHKAVEYALRHCANPGRGGHQAAMEASRQVFACREEASRLFRCPAERVVMTMNCTHGLNIAINSLIPPGSRVVISGFEHNAVTRPLHDRRVKIQVAGRRLFDWADTLEDFEQSLKKGADAAVFTHVSNVFGYVLPVEEMAALCRNYGVPFILDAAQSAGVLPVNMESLGAAYIAMPGHKGLLGPQGTGLLLCGHEPKPLLFGGTGSESMNQSMPSYLPDRLEAGTLNVPGIAGLAAGLRYVQSRGIDRIFQQEHRAMTRAIADLKALGFQPFAGAHQAATVSFVPRMDCEEATGILAKQGIAVRAGLHCAPLAHESAGTLETGTVRISFGHDANSGQNAHLRSALAKIIPLQA